MASEISGVSKVSSGGGSSGGSSISTGTSTGASSAGASGGTKSADAGGSRKSSGGAAGVKETGGTTGSVSTKQSGISAKDSVTLSSEARASTSQSQGQQTGKIGGTNAGGGASVSFSPQAFRDNFSSSGAIDTNGQKNVTAATQGGNDPLVDRYGSKLAKDALTKPPVELGKAAAEKMNNAGMKWSIRGVEGALAGSKALGGDLKDALKMTGGKLAKFAGPAGIAYDILGNPSVANAGEARDMANYYIKNGQAVPQNVQDWVRRENGN
jgi:hypothetical protein